MQILKILRDIVRKILTHLCVSISTKSFRSKSSFLNSKHVYSILIFAVLSFQIFKIYHSVKMKSRCDVNPLFSPKISLFRSLERS